ERLAAADAQVADDEVAEHFGEEVVEIGARADALHEALVPLFRVPKVQAVEARVVEEVALDPPRLVEHLRPFLAWRDSDLDVLRVEQTGARWRGRGRRSRRRRARRGRRRRQRPDEPLVALAREHLVAAGRDLEESHAGGGDVALA